MQNKSVFSKDQNFKKIIKNKSLLSYIFHEFVDEYKGMDRKEIESLISLKGIVHKNKKDIVTFNSEIGNVRADSVMGAYLPDSNEQIGVMLDIEMQRKGESIDKLYNRAEYYLSAIMVNQKDSIFEHDYYEDMIKVNGIWLCLHQGKHAINQYEMKENCKVGNLHVNKKAYKNKKIQFIYIGDKGEEENLEPLRILFFGEEDVDEKLKILKERYDIDLLDEKREVSKMCTLEELYQEIYEDRGMEKGMKKGMQKGMEKGMEKRTIEHIKTLMNKLNESYDSVAKLLDLNEEEIKRYRELVLN